MSQLLKRLRQKDRKAQYELYQQVAGKMLSVCKRYVGSAAEDVFIEAMLVVFEKIDQYDEAGPIEAWIRRIVVNQALQFLRRGKLLFAELNDEIQVVDDYLPDNNLNASELMELIEQLPDGYRTVFNLYAIEGYSHQEVADLLGITIGTSKSQLSRARTLLQNWLSVQEPKTIKL
jgi:RNA polymerase sigma-70 factor (ECF subfamily)